MLHKMHNFWQLRKRRVIISAAMLGIVGFGLAGAAASGAWFSDTQSGVISGTIGSIQITTSGGIGTNSANFAFSNMLPGVPQTVTVYYQNTGANNEDVWIKFPNVTALSALNNLGTYGEVHLSANGTDLFDSANLNDRVATCGPLSPSGCWPLASEYLVASNVGPTGSGSVSFTFNYAGKMSTQPSAGTTTYWNVYPVPAGLYSSSNPNGQTYVNASDSSGNGLPYEIVAVQPGQTP